MLGLGHTELMVATTDDGIAVHDLLHRFSRRDPGTTSQCKTVTDVDAHTQTEGVGLHEGLIYQMPEVIAQGISLTTELRTLYGTADGHQITTTQSYILHGLQVGTDTLC